MIGYGQLVGLAHHPLMNCCAPKLRTRTLRALHLVRVLSSRYVPQGEGRFLTVFLRARFRLRVMLHFCRGSICLCSCLKPSTYIAAKD
jgi:hypothetical protein